jgi:hypothetical protein
LTIGLALTAGRRIAVSKSKPKPSGGRFDREPVAISTGKGAYQDLPPIAMTARSMIF